MITMGDDDIFDIVWVESDPCDRDITLLQDVISKREAAGKHMFPPDHLEVDQIRDIIRDPDRIDYSLKYDDREIYYQQDDGCEYPLARAVVKFKTEQSGTVISWSRYKHTVSSCGVRYRKEGGQL